MSTHRFMMMFLCISTSTTSSSARRLDAQKPSWQDHLLDNWGSESSQLCSYEQTLLVGETLMENGSELDDCVPVDSQEIVEHEVEFDVATAGNEPFILPVCPYPLCRQVIKDTYEKLSPAANCVVRLYSDTEEGQDKTDVVTVDFHHLFGKIMDLCRIPLPTIASNSLTLQKMCNSSS